jgi:hypothetical protein
MVNYCDSIIYKICNISCDEVYVGSTTNFLRRRAEHKKCCNNVNGKSYNYQVYKFIRDHGGFENWSMIQIEPYNAKNKRDLEARERYWLEQLGATLNKCIPTRTLKEYRIDNKETIIQQKKEYYEKNKETLSQYQKEHYEKNKQIISQKGKEKILCSCGCEINKNSLSRHLKTKLHNLSIN